MKKLFTLLIFLCAALSSSADEHIVYLCPGWTNSDWAKDGARFALYMYKDGGGSEWVDFVPMSYTENGYDNGVLISRKVYGAVFSSGENNYDHFILCRMDPEKLANNWDNKWNQSENISAPTEDVFYDLTGWGAWDHGSINDYAKKSFSFVVTGDKQVVTNNEGWNSSSTNNVMTKTGAFTYSFNVPSQFVAPGNEFKVVFQPMGWWHGDPNNSGANFPVSIGEMGCYSIDYTFNFQTGVATASATKDNNKVVRFYLAEVTGTSANGRSHYDDYWWNNMMETSGAKATFYAPNKSLTAGENTLKYKVIRSVQSANSSDPWDNKWYAGSVGLDCDFGYSPESTGSFNVTFSWDAKAETSSVEAAELPSSYYVVGGAIGGNWTVGNQITGVNNVFTVDFAEQQGKGFVLVPNYDVSAGNVTNWSHAIRPLSDTDIIFANNTGMATIIDNAQNWRFETYNGHAIFTYNGLTNHWTVEPYFERTLPAAAEGYATFSSDKNVAIPGDITAAMYPSEVSSTGAITWTRFTNGIPAGQGALLQGVAGKSYKFTPVENPDVVSGDGSITMEAIDAKVAETPLQQIADGCTNYILWKSSNVVGFYKVNSKGSYVNAGTAYLKVPNEDPSDPEGAPAFFPLTGETTAIDNLTTEPAQKGEEKIYSLDGRRIVGQPTAKGIYIVNGKKLLKK